MTARDGLADSAYRAALFSAFAHGWSTFGVRNAILPLFAAAVILDDPWVAGTALAVFAAGNALGLTRRRPPGRRARSPPVHRRRAARSAVSPPRITGLATGLLILMLVSVIAGVGSGALYPAQQASLADIVGRDRNGGPGAGGIPDGPGHRGDHGPIIAGLLVDFGSYGLAFGVTGAISLIAIIPWLRARETLRAQSPA